MSHKNKVDKNDIVETAFEYVRKNGWEGLSARYLAGRLDCSTMPIYSQIGSMSNLEEEVVKKALALFNRYVETETTGDRWLDQAIGYVRFAMEEKMLFRCINDDKHASLQRKNSRQMWKTLGEALSDYPPFQNMSKTEIDRVRVMRWFFVHGVASLVNNGWFPLEKTSSETFSKTMDIGLIDLLNIADHSILEGLKDYGSAKNPEIRSIEKKGIKKDEVSSE